MYNPVDAKQSFRNFHKFAAPALQALFGTKRIFSTERHDSELATFFDFAGVDAIIVTEDGEIYLCSSRVQFGVNYSAFSIRRSRPNGAMTEYDKLQKPLQVKPTFHIQTFVDKDEQSAIVACAETVDLLKYINKHRDQWRTAPTGETFYYIPFAELENAKIFRVDATGNAKKINRS